MLTLLAGTAETAEPPRLPECSAASRVDLTTEPNEAPLVCATPEEPVTFVFDSPLPPGAVAVESGNRSVSVAQGDDFVTVYPKRGFLPTERVKLMVRFADGAAPESARFWLVGHAARGARRVEVFRHPRSADALEKEAAEAQAGANQCQEEKARLLTERKEPGGLMGAAWLERTVPMQSKDIWRQAKYNPDNALPTQAARSYSHPGSIAVKLRFLNPGTEPWTAEGAVLKDSAGASVELSVWQETAISSDTIGAIVVGAQREPGQLSCPCTLKLWEAQGTRTVTIGNVTFPAVKRNPEPK
ncbi:DUF2381 family protein [Archangium violaceum]|nr:DUF2381 family protein [Archangium violaceum]